MNNRGKDPIRCAKRKKKSRNKNKNTKEIKNKKAKANNIRCSQAVSHPSTNRTRRCLTSLIGREAVYSTWYGRWQNLLLLHSVFIAHLPRYSLINGHWQFTRVISTETSSVSRIFRHSIHPCMHSRTSYSSVVENYSRENRNDSSMCLLRIDCVWNRFSLQKRMDGCNEEINWNITWVDLCS